MELCPQCKVEMNIMVSVTMTMPSSMMGNITKDKLRGKDVQTDAIFWDGGDYLCPKCGFLIESKVSDLTGN